MRHKKCGMILFCAAILALMTPRSDADFPARRALTSDEEIARLRADPAVQEEAKKLRQSLDHYFAMSYEELWNFIPPAAQLRAVNVAFDRGCPICGREIFRKAGHYPWKRGPDRPFKVQCPICKTVFPSNDFKPWTTARGQLKPGPDDKYFDDGFGYINEKGEPFYFVAYYVFWQVWRELVPGAISGMSRLYLITGDEEAGRRAVIMLGRLASEYPKMDYNAQAVHIGRWPSGYAGKICDYVWENSSATTYPAAYDNVRDVLSDPAAVEFLKTKGIEDPRVYILQNLLQEIVKAYLDRNIHGNMGWQQHLMQAVRAINNDDPAYGHTTKEMVDWLLYGGGEIAVLLYNGVTQDGAGSEGSPGYNGMWWTNLYRLARPMKELGYDMWSVPPWAPRLKKMSDYYIDNIVAENYVPSIGDTGHAMKPMEEIKSPVNFRLAYEKTGDLRFLRQLRRCGEDVTPLLDRLDEPTRSVFLAEKPPYLLSPRTRDLGGYGLAVLESGSGDNARAVAMYYGSQGAWHDHKDRLNIEYIGRGTSYLPEMGYPAHWGDKAYEWTMGTASHYTVLIDENGHAGKPPGSLHMLADGKWARVMEASGERLYPGCDLYRRTVVMIDLGPADSYLVDVFRVSGGRKHDYSFHGLPRAELSFEGVEFGPEQPGTVSGRDAPFGKRPTLDYRGNGYYYLEKPRYSRPAGAWRATWRAAGDAEKPRGLRLHVPENACSEAILALAEPELDRGNPERMEWLLLRNAAGKDQTARSDFISVIEPFEKDASIAGVEKLTAKDEAAARQAGWVGLRIRHSLATDTICSALDETAMIETSDGVRFQGRFGAIRKASTGEVSTYLAGCSVMEAGGAAASGGGIVRAKVSRVLYDKNAIEIEPALAAPERFIGRVAVISSGDHRTSYTIISAENADGRSRLCFGDVTCVIGIVEASEPGPAPVSKDRPALGPNEFVTRTRLNGYGIKFEAVPIAGLSAVSEDFSACARIVARDVKRITLEEGAAVSAFGDADGDGRRMIYLSDISVGEDVALPTIIDTP